MKSFKMSQEEPMMLGNNEIHSQSDYVFTKQGNFRGRLDRLTSYQIEWFRFFSSY